MKPLPGVLPLGLTLLPRLQKLVDGIQRGGLGHVNRHPLQMAVRMPALPVRAAHAALPRACEAARHAPRAARGSWMAVVPPRGHLCRQGRRKRRYDGPSREVLRGERCIQP